MLSIVIPTREEEKVIQRAITELREGLSGIPHEIIVSDARSSDKTAEIARQFSDVVVVFEGEKHTAGIGRNDGAKASHGEIIAFLDADVIIPDPSSFFRRALAHFEDQQVVGVTGPQRARPDIARWSDTFSYGIVNMEMRALNAVGSGVACGKFMMVRREHFEKVRGFREDLVTYEDGDFFKRLSAHGKTVFDPALFIYHDARRPHAIGWPRLWYTWTINILWYTFFDTALADDWTPIR